MYSKVNQWYLYIYPLPFSKWNFRWDNQTWKWVNEKNWEELSGETFFLVKILIPMGWLQTTEWTLNHPSPFPSLYWQHGGSSKELREQLSQQLTAECSSRLPNLCNAGFVTLTQSHWDGMYQETTVLGRCTFHVQTFTRCAVHLIYAEE